MDEAKELFEIARIIRGIDHYSERNDAQLDEKRDQVESLFQLAHQKYPNLLFELKRDVAGLSIQIYVFAESVKGAFDSVASRIKGLSYIGLQSFQEASLQDAELFAKLVEEMSEQVYLTYTLDGATDTIVLGWDGQRNLVHVGYTLPELMKPYSPQFQFLLQYMVKEKKDIPLLTQAQSISFIDVEEETVFEWEDEYFPKLLE